MSGQDHLHLALQKQVLSAFGIKTVGIEECLAISIRIFTKDRNYLSETTLQSFFGLKRGKCVPTPFLLDTLARFLDYGGWEDFKRCLIQTHEFEFIDVETGALPRDEPSNISEPDHESKIDIGFKDNPPYSNL